MNFGNKWKIFISVLRGVLSGLLLKLGVAGIILILLTLFMCSNCILDSY
jgi:hypothetical protein